MKQFLILFLILFSVQAVHAQQKLIKKKENGFWGFVDISGTVVIDFQYQKVYPFYEEMSLAQKDNLWGFIDKKGAIIVPFEFSKVQKYLSAKIIQAKKNEFWYLYNLNGELIELVDNDYLSGDYKNV